MRLQRQSLHNLQQIRPCPEPYGTPEPSVAQVAESLGLSDGREFRRAFKRWTGNVPTAVRDGATAAAGSPSGGPPGSKAEGLNSVVE